MSLMNSLKIRSIWFSMIEVAVFLGLSVLYFMAPTWVAKAYGSHVTAWMWIVAALVYLLIVTLWWSPGEHAADDTELHALAIVLVAAAIAAGIYVELKYGLIWNLCKEFWNILSTGGRTS